MQADSSHARRFQGTGLGLAISKRLVEAMGGQIGVKNAGVRGSVFWVHLPLQGAGIQTRQAVLAGKNVAMITNSAVLRDGLKLQLQATGAVMLPCNDLAELRAEKRKCDALLLDVSAGDADSIPDVSGLGIATVVLVPPESRAQVADYASKGIRGYLTKPVRQGSLETRLAAIISGGGEGETKVTPKAIERRSGHAALSVLLAEDNPVNALLARELLRRRGHRIHEVTNGEAAVEACVGNRFDLVLMDLHMPGMDGIEAAMRIRAAEAQSGAHPMPIYALTADALETGRKACLDAGMDGFLTKPVDPAELDVILASVGNAAAIAA